MEHNKVVIKNITYQAVRDVLPSCEGCQAPHCDIALNCAAEDRDDNTEVRWKPHYSGPEIARLIRNEVQKAKNLAPYFAASDRPVLDLWPHVHHEVKGFVDIPPGVYKGNMSLNVDDDGTIKGVTIKPCDVPDPLPTMKGFVGLGPLPKVSRIFHGTVDPMAQCYMPIILK